MTAIPPQQAAGEPKLRLPIFLAHFQGGIMFVTLGPLLDSILRDLHIPLAQGGLPALAFNLGAAVSTTPFPWPAACRLRSVSLWSSAICIWQYGPCPAPGGRSRQEVAEEVAEEAAR